MADQECINVIAARYVDNLMTTDTLDFDGFIEQRGRQREIKKILKNMQAEPAQVFQGLQNAKLMEKLAAKLTGGSKCQKKQSQETE